MFRIGAVKNRNVTTHPTLFFSFFFFFLSLTYQGNKTCFQGEELRFVFKKPVSPAPGRNGFFPPPFPLGPDAVWDVTTGSARQPPFIRPVPPLSYREETNYQNLRKPLSQCVGFPPSLFFFPFSSLWEREVACSLNSTCFSSMPGEVPPQEPQELSQSVSPLPFSLFFPPPRLLLTSSELLQVENSAWQFEREVRGLQVKQAKLSLPKSAPFPPPPFSSFFFFLPDAPENI